MKTAGTIIAYIVGAALAIGIYALVAWGVSVLVTFLFGLDGFGFWHAVAAMLLASIFGGLFFGRYAKAGAS